MSVIKKLSYTLFLFGALWSCNPEEDKTYEIIADVFIKTKILNSDTVHAVVYTTVSYSKMKSVVVGTPSGEEVVLEPHHPGKLVYVNEPDDSVYTAEIPEIGRYNFEIIFDNNDEEKESNSLSEKYILPPGILALEYNAGAEEAYMNFGNVEGADAYLMKVYSGGVLIYSSYPIIFDSPQESYGVYISREAFKDYVPGELTFEVASVLYENISDPDFLQAYGSSTGILTIE